MRSDILVFGPLSASLVFSALAAAGSPSPSTFEFRGAGWLDLPDPRGNAVSTDFRDLTGDGVPEAVASFDGGDPVLRTFSPGEAFSFTEISSAKVSSAGEVSLMDLTDDGIPDAVIFKRDFQDSQVVILSGNGDGTFTFLASRWVGYNQDPGQLLAGDLDGDHHTDLIYAGNRSFLARGPEFSSYDFLPTGQYSATGVAMFDADGDGRRDLLLSLDRAYFSLLRRIGPSLFQVYEFTGGGWGPLVLWDVDGDGMVEIVAETSAGAAAFRLTRPLNDWVLTQIPLQDGPPASLRSLFDDLDHDGLLDQVSLTGAGLLSVVFGTRKEGQLRLDGPPVVTELPGPPVSWDFRSRDLNGDGLQDVLLRSNFYLLQERDRSFRAARPTGLTQSFWRGGEAFDLNGDGYDDLARIFEGRLEVSLGGDRGLGAPAGVPIALPGPLVAGRLRPQDPGVVLARDGEGVKLFQVGSDGQPRDPAVVGVPFPEDYGLALAPWNGGASNHLLEIRKTLQGATILSVFDLSNLASPTEVFKVFVPERSAFPKGADLDGDGKTDLIFATEYGVQVVRGNLAETTLYQETVLAPWDRVQALAAIDLERDGLWEVVASGSAASDRSVRLFRRQEAGGWSSEIVSRVGARALRVVDLEGDGAADLVAVGAGFEVFRNRGRGLDLPPERVRLRDSGDSLEVLDLDGDGRLDLLTLNDRSITVCYGETEGGFPSSPELATLVSNPQLDSADFNGDGLIDFVVNQEFGNDAIIFGTPDRSYATLSDLPGDAAGSIQIAAGDFDGDGRADLVAPFWQDRMIHLLRGKGDGTFESPGLLPLPPSGRGGFILTAGPLDGDGVRDLIAYGQPSSINIHLGGPDLLSREPLVLDAGGSIRNGTLADLDSDGRVDLVVTVEPPDLPFPISRCFPGRGDGTFGEPVELPPLNGSFTHVFGDLDGDRIPDAAVYFDRSGGMAIFLGRGDFTFSEPLARPDTDFRPIDLQDLDGDRIPEVIGDSGTRAIMVLRGLGKGEFEAPRSFGWANILLVRDMNGDGLPDLLHSFATGGSPDPLSIIPASPATLLEWPRTYLLPMPAGCTPCTVPQEQRLISGDFNGDGRRVLAASTPGNGFVQLLLADRARELHQVGLVSLAGVASDGAPLFLAATDLDGDGREDLATLFEGAIWWFPSLGSSSFADPRKILTGAPVNTLSFPDLNADGQEDLLVSGFSVALGLGGGRFGGLRTYLQAGDFPSAVGDFNGDGIPDIVQSMGRNGATLQFQGGAGGGRFDGQEALLSAGRPTGGMAVGDFNGDHLPDIAHGLAGTDQKAPLRVWYSRRGGFFEQGPDLHDPVGADEGTSALVAADLDRDGIEDLLSADPAGYVLVYFGSSQGLKEPPLVTHGSRNADLFLAGNFTGDTTLDLLSGGENGLFLTAGALTGEFLFRRGEADGNDRLDLNDPVLLLRWLFLGGSRPECLDAADLDDNGSLDLNDPVFLLGFLYLGGLPPPEPFQQCGPDPNFDALDCQFNACGAEEP